MEQKKSKKADLERKRPLWFLIGLVMPTLVFVALLELVTWSGRSSTSDNALDDFLEEMEQRPKKEREDMVAAMDVRKQKPKEAERVNIVDEPKEMSRLRPSPIRISRATRRVRLRQTKMIREKTIRRWLP